MDMSMDGIGGLSAENPNPFLPEPGLSGVIAARTLSLLQTGTTLMAMGDQRVCSEMTWKSLRGYQSAVLSMGANPEQAQRAVAFEGVVAIAMWSEMHHVAADEEASGPPDSAVDSYLRHAMADRRMEAVHVLDWADQLPGADLVGRSFSLLDAMRGRTELASQEARETNPRLGAMSAALCILMQITQTRLGDMRDVHRGHGCQMDPDAEDGQS